MSTINIGRDNADQSYRYKMPKLFTKIEGRGNGIKTVIVNMTEIAKALKIHPDYPTHYFGIEAGAQARYTAKDERAVVNGSHTPTDLAKMLDKFIEIFVLCPTCKLPETRMKVKQSRIKIDCAACGYNGVLDTPHKLATYILKNPPNKLDEPGTDGKKKKKDDGDKDEDKKKKKKKSESDEEEAGDGEKKKKTETEDGEKSEKKKKKKKKEETDETGEKKKKKKKKSSDKGEDDEDKDKKKKKKKKSSDKGDGEEEKEKEDKKKKKKEKKDKKKEDEQEEEDDDDVKEAKDSKESTKAASKAPAQPADSASESEESEEEEEDDEKASDKKKKDGDWQADTSKQAQKKRKEAEMAEQREAEKKLTDITNAIEQILTIAKEENKQDSPAILLRIFLAEKNRSGDELYHEARRIQMARDLDPVKRMKVVLEALLDGSNPKTSVPNVIKYAKAFQMFCTDKPSKTILLGSLEEVVGVIDTRLTNRIPILLKAFYDLGLLEEEQIIQWADMPEASMLHNKEAAARVRKAAKPFVDWLKSAEEEEDDD